MSNNENFTDLSPSRTLRQRAEEMLRAALSDKPEIASHEIQTLVHELQVHQMELEIQNEELRLAQVALAESHDRYSNLYDFAPVGYVTLDTKGRVLESNFTAATMLGVARRQFVGGKLSKFVAPQGQDEFYLHQRTVFASETKQYCELPMLTENGTPRVVRLESVRHTHNKDGGEQAFIALIDVSETKHAQDEVAELNRDLEQRVTQRTDALQMLHAVATMANLAESAEQAICSGLQRVCQFNGWRFGHAYLPAADKPNKLVLAYVSSQASADQSSRDLEPRLRSLEIGVGEGLVGRVYSTGNAEFTSDLSQTLSMERIPLAESLNIQVAAAFPIMVGNRVEGVLEFFSDERVRPDTQLLDAMSDVGMQLGRVIERDRASLDLRTRESHYRSLVETAGSAIVGLTPDHTIVEWNREAERIFGWAREEVIGKNYFEIILPKESHQAVPAVIQRELEGSPAYNYENVVNCRQGIVRTISWNATRLLNSAQQPSGIIAIGRDVTEQKRAERLLRENEQRLDLALSASGIGIWDANLLTGELTVDQRWAAILGYTLEEIDPTMEAGDALIHPDDLARVQQAREHHLQDPTQSFSHEFRMQTKSGQWKWVHSSGRITQWDDDGTPLRLTGTIGDITERKQLERDVVETAAEQQRRIGRELHDGIGGELTGIGFTVQGLIEDLRQCAVEEAAIAENVGEELDRVIEQVRLLSCGLNPVEIDRHGLGVALDRLTKRTEKLYRIDCELQCDASVEIHDSFLADHLYRIAQEAVTNAIRHGHPRRILLTLHGHHDKLVLQVVDDGQGSDPKDLSTDGMGLRNMRYRAGLIGADLLIERVPEGGTRVRVQHTATN